VGNAILCLSDAAVQYIHNKDDIEQS